MQCGKFFAVYKLQNSKQRAAPLNEEARSALENRGRFRAEHCPDSTWVFSHRKGKCILNVHYGFKAAYLRLLARAGGGSVAESVKAARSLDHRNDRVLRAPGAGKPEGRSRGIGPSTIWLSW